MWEAFWSGVGECGRRAALQRVWGLGGNGFVFRFLDAAVLEGVELGEGAVEGTGEGGFVAEDAIEIGGRGDGGLVEGDVV